MKQKTKNTQNNNDVVETESASVMTSKNGALAVAMGAVFGVGAGYVSTGAIDREMDNTNIEMVEQEIAYLTEKYQETGNAENDSALYQALVEDKQDIITQAKEGGVDGTAMLLGTGVGFLTALTFIKAQSFFMQQVDIITAKKSQKKSSAPSKNSHLKKV